MMDLNSKYVLDLKARRIIFKNVCFIDKLNTSNAAYKMVLNTKKCFES
jgi:hypothetical protein